MRQKLVCFLAGLMLGALPIALLWHATRAVPNGNVLVEIQQERRLADAWHRRAVRAEQIDWRLEHRAATLDELNAALATAEDRATTCAALSRQASLEDARRIRNDGQD